MNIDPTYQDLAFTEKTQALSEPFDPADLYYKPQTVTKDKKRALVAVYADPRAYSDRLNEVFGPGQWSEHYQLQVVPFRKLKKGWEGKPDELIEGHKLIVVCTVEINGVGSHSSLGEAMTDDENVATGAEAQAFKRACTKFGLGRYLYDFPKDQWCDYDDKSKKVTKPPELPDWALPNKKCEDCGHVVTEYSAKDNSGNEIVYSVSRLLENSRRKYSKDLCIECQKTRANAAKATAGTRLQPTPGQ